MAEARRAAEILGAGNRVTLDFENRRLLDGFEPRVALARVFRRFRPRLVLGLGDRTPMASPDHYQAMSITEAAVFYSRLSKWDDHFEGLEPYRVPAYMLYFLAYRELVPGPSARVVFDVSDTLEKKIASIAAYKTQFAHRPEVLDRIRTFNRQQGLAAGFAAGEVLAHPTTLGTRDLMAMLFGPK